MCQHRKLPAGISTAHKTTDYGNQTGDRFLWQNAEERLLTGVLTPIKTTVLPKRSLRIHLCITAAVTLFLRATPAVAQEPQADAPATATVADKPAIAFRVEAERVIPAAGGGRLILQRVAEPVLPPAAPAVPPPQLSPEERAARLAARQGGMRQTCFLWFYVTLHPDGLSYVEWWPSGGGGRYAAWSRADFRYMGLIPDFNLESTDTRYHVFPAIFRRPLPGSAPAAPPPIPADGPGFVLVKGDPDNTRATAPIAAMHQVYARDFATLKSAYEQRQADAADAAAQPPPPPGDVVIKFWPLRTAAAPTPAPAAR